MGWKYIPQLLAYLLPGPNWSELGSSPAAVGWHATHSETQSGQMESAGRGDERSVDISGAGFVSVVILVSGVLPSRHRAWQVVSPGGR